MAVFKPQLLGAAILDPTPHGSALGAGQPLPLASPSPTAFSKTNPIFLYSPRGLLFGTHGLSPSSGGLWDLQSDLYLFLASSLGTNLQVAKCLTDRKSAGFSKAKGMTLLTLWTWCGGPRGGVCVICFCYLIDCFFPFGYLGEWMGYCLPNFATSGDLLIHWGLFQNGLCEVPLVMLCAAAFSRQSRCGHFPRGWRCEGRPPSQGLAPPPGVTGLLLTAFSLSLPPSRRPWGFPRTQTPESQSDFVSQGLPAFKQNKTK